MKNHAKIFVFYFFAAAKLSAMFSPSEIFTLGALPKAMKLAAALEANKTCLDHLQAALFAAAKENNAVYIHGIANLKGININATLDNKAAVLHHAAFYGSTFAAQALLDRGADINIGDDKNLTALIIAVLQGHIGMVELFLERGATISMIKGPGGEQINLLDGIIMIEDRDAEILRQKQSEIAVALIKYGARTHEQETLQLLTTLGVQYPTKGDQNGASKAQAQ